MISHFPLTSLGEVAVSSFLNQATGGGGDFEVSQVRVGNFAFLIGHNVSHANPGAFAKFTAHEPQIL